MDLINHAPDSDLITISGDNHKIVISRNENGTVFVTVLNRGHVKVRSVLGIEGVTKEL